MQVQSRSEWRNGELVNVRVRFGMNASDNRVSVWGELERVLERESGGSRWREREKHKKKRPTGAIEGRRRLDFAEWWSGRVLSGRWLIAQKQRDRETGTVSTLKSAGLCFSKCTD